MKQFRNTPYYVTEDGDVLKHMPEISWETNHSVNGKVYTYTKTRKEYFRKLKPGIQSAGYKQVVLHDGFDKPTNFRIHRLVAELYVNGYFEDAHVDHIDCNKLNNHYTNLQWCTKEYNHQKADKLDYPLFCQIE